MISLFQPSPLPRPRTTPNRRKSVAAIPPNGTSALSATLHPSTVSQHSIPFKSAQAHLEFLSPVLPQKAFSVHLNVKFPSVLSNTKSNSSLVGGGDSDSHSSTHWAGPGELQFRNKTPPQKTKQLKLIKFKKMKSVLWHLHIHLLSF